MRLVEIRIELPPAGADRADECLQELATATWALFEDVVAGRAWISGVFADAPDAAAEWTRLAPVLAEAGVEPAAAPVYRELPEAEWKDSYRRHFHAWRFGPLNWVPVWERDTFVVPPGEQVLWLDPGMAFGTGNHETTRLCCERLVRHAAERGTAGRVLDAGCGSGILALSAARLGFPDVAGFDNDPVAIEVSRENAAMNGLADRVDFFVADLRAGLAGREAELVLANIQADVLMRFAPELGRAVAPGGRLVLSGILQRELDQVREVFAAALPGWKVETATLGEWSDQLWARPAD